VETTTVAIAGGGPAGIILGLLLARAGVEVTVLEKHADFLRDFRGDTVHPSTQQLLFELGLREEFESIVVGRMSSIRFGTADQVIVEADLEKVRPRHRFHDIAIAPQWDLLDLLTRYARRFPAFHLLLSAEVTGTIRDGDRVQGVRYRTQDGDHELRAVLTIAADGRSSTVRESVGSELRDFKAPLDVLWFRLSREPEDPDGLTGLLGDRAIAVAINRDTYWQIAYLVTAGRDPEVRSGGLAAFRDAVAALLPFAAGRTTEIASFEDVKTLQVRIQQLKRWYAPGILAIGDAAHTMSPMGGVGINLAVQDGVAAANLLAAPLFRAQQDPLRFERTLSPRLLARVQRRRKLPSIVPQAMQAGVQRGLLGKVLARGTAAIRIPRALRPLLRNGPGAKIVWSIFGYGLLPEHIRSPERTS